jgi:hypothetical protein
MLLNHFERYLHYLEEVIPSLGIIFNIIKETKVPLEKDVCALLVFTASPVSSFRLLHGGEDIPYLISDTIRKCLRVEL